ncbi:DUF1330 domain-containing protein [Cystobacter fuscus]|uniref:DUF1330 domain-containing protein n=1 Tax=Cystobacter fuscus TaxID=43 RepID=UPI002B30D042|nr:DUF1330 domain-containing protein [Cystobacter fuscus]
MRTLMSDEVKRFIKNDDGKPVVMLNLLRFQPGGGRERYSKYIALSGPLVARYGGEVLYVGDGLPALAAEDGQAWDAVALVKYPSRKAFADMIEDPDYIQQAGPMRESSLLEAVLQPLRTVNV